MNSQQIFKEAFRPSVIKRSLLMAVIVGPILISINHANCLVNGCFGWECAIKSFVTLMVPYSVSTVSSVLAVNEKKSTSSIGDNKITATNS